MKHLFVRLATCTLFFFFAYSVIACTCGTLPVCEAYGSAKAVFAGKVVEGNAAERMSDVMTAQTKDLTFKFSVSRAFIGAKKGDVVNVHTGFGFGDCGFPFEKGEEYLVYAFGGSSGNLQTGICSRTKHISHADEEVTDLEALLLHDGAGVTGTLTRYDRSSLIGEPFSPLPNKAVKLVRVGSRKTYKSVTNKDGEFEFTKLPTGRYRLKYDVEPGWTIDDYETEEFLLNEHGCAYKNLSIENDSDVKVVVLDPDGKPVPNVWVEFVPLGFSSTTNKNPKEFSVTNPQGGLYTFDLPPGNYTVSINFLNAPDKDAPFPATFAPGVLQRDKARVIEIKPGSQINDIVIRVPKKLEERVFSGAVFWPDGTPVQDAGVFLLDMVAEDEFVNSSVDTDSDVNRGQACDPAILNAKEKGRRGVALFF